jgi:hypothetical protein
MGAKRSRARKQRRANAPKQPLVQEPPVNRFAAAHGDYADETIVDLNNELGHGRNRTFRVLRNRAGTTVERWLSAGALSRGQTEAISLYCWSYRLRFGTEQRVIANYHVAGTIRGIPADPSVFIDSQIEAKEFLDQVEKDIFSLCNPKWKDCWQMVVLYDEAAGVAGSRLGFKNKGAEASARAICEFIADQIAYRWRLG